MAAAAVVAMPVSQDVSMPKRRLKRGARTEDWRDLQLSPSTSTARTSTTFDFDEALKSLDSIESPFQVQEYLNMLLAEDPHDVDRVVWLPRRRKVASTTAAATDKALSPGKGKEKQLESNDSTSADDGTDDTADEFDEPYIEKEVWLYEHLRRLVIDLSHPFVASLQEVCSRETCPEMKAGEWLYLCAAHSAGIETECCAIDYIIHTLDGATSLLNASRFFPSRLSVPQMSLRHFSSVARRLYRIFAHAWFHHRETFDACESETSLYERFLLLSKEYDLVSEDLLVIPSRAAARHAIDAEEGVTEEQHPRGERIGSVERQPEPAPVLAKAEAGNSANKPLGPISPAKADKPVSAA